MRELVFALDYEPGCNPVADTLATHSDAAIRSLSCHVTPESLWRVDHVTGEREAVAALEDAFFEAEYCSDCLVTEDCGADCEVQVLDHTDETLVLYTYWDRTSVCTSVPHLALEWLGNGLLFETQREGRRYTWRINHVERGQYPRVLRCTPQGGRRVRRDEDAATDRTRTTPLKDDEYD